MPNGPSLYNFVCDRFGLEEQHRSKLFWATVLGTPVLLWALSSRSKAKKKPDTHINAFFKDKSAVRAPPAQQPKRKGTGFHSFLKEVPQAHRDATSFGAFLKGPASAAAVVSSNAPSQQASKGPKASDVVISVLFGTEYGFSKEVAERVAAAVTACGPYWYATRAHTKKCHILKVCCSSQLCFWLAGSSFLIWLITLMAWTSARSRLSLLSAQLRLIPDFPFLGRPCLVLHNSSTPVAAAQAAEPW